MNELRWILLGLGIALIGVIYLFSRSRTESPEVDIVDGMRFEPKLDTHADNSASQDGGVATADLEAPRVTPSLSSDDSAHSIGTSETVNNLSSEPATESSAANPSEADRSGVDNSGVEHSGLERSGDGYSDTHNTSTETTAPVAEKVIALHLVPKDSESFAGIEFVGALQAEGLKYGRFDIFHRYVDETTSDPGADYLFSVANLVKPGTISLHNLDQQAFKGASMFLVLPGPEDAVAAFADMVATGRRMAATLNGQLLDGHGTQLSRQRASHLREDIINYQHGISSADPVA